MRKKHEFIFKFSCIINKMPILNFIVARRNNININNALLIGCSIKCKGSNNTIIIKKNALLYRCKITILGNDNYIVIGENTVSKYANINIEDCNNKVLIGAKTRLCGKIKIACIESSEIIIGENCLFSSEIEIRTGDSHGIYNDKGIRINHAKNIYIGNHVWIGFRVIILKGSLISDDSIIGAGTIVTHEFKEKNCIIVGAPGNIIKKNVIWDKYRRDKI